MGSSASRPQQQQHHQQTSTASLQQPFYEHGHSSSASHAHAPPTNPSQPHSSPHSSANAPPQHHSPLRQPQPQHVGAPSGRAPPVTRSLTMAFQNKYGIIPDQFTSVAQVQQKLREVGLESSNLVVGVDFTKSNEWTGMHSFGGHCLHSLSTEVLNPYETAISIIGRTLSSFDEDNLIPCFGFGDVSTHDTGVFSFHPNDVPCAGFVDVLHRYRTIVPHVKLSGPTSFAPVIEAAVKIVELSGGQYHVLLIIADGQVTRSVDLEPEQLSVQEAATIEAICAASNYPLSIVLVGVGDGPWDMMEMFDDRLPARNFDNFQFVNLTRIMETQGSREQLEAKFALLALMEVPFQFKACTELGLIGRCVGRMPNIVPKPPPSHQLPDHQNAAFSSTRAPVDFQESGMPLGAPSAPAADTECPVCLQAPKAMAFQCGHQTCIECGEQMHHCPICRTPVALRIKLY